MIFRDLTEEEFCSFQELLCSHFEIEIKDFYLDFKAIDLICQDVSLVSYDKAYKLNGLNENTIPINEIHFYSKTKKSEIYFLIKHFRNCGSHYHRIKIAEENNVRYLLFKDATKAYTSMIAIIEDELFYKFYNYILSEANSKKTNKIPK